MTDLTATATPAADPEPTNPSVARTPHPRTSDPREGAWSRSRRLAIAVLLLAAAAAVDLPLAKSTFDLALRLPEPLSWAVSIGVMAIAVSGAWKAGVALQRRRFAEAIGAACVPLVVAAALFVLRWNAHMFSNTTAGWGGTASESTVDVAAEQVLAIVMLLFLLGTTALAVYDGSHLTDDAGALVRSAGARLDAVEKDEATQEGKTLRLGEETAKATYILRQAVVDEQTALASLDARRDELKAFARTEIARVLGNPAATSAVIVAQRAADESSTNPAAANTTEKLTIEKED